MGDERLAADPEEAAEVSKRHGAGFTLIELLAVISVVAILVAIGLFRSGRAMDVFESIVKPVTNLINMPPSILPLCVIRPLSGSGARGIMMEIFKEYTGAKELKTHNLVALSLFDDKVVSLSRAKLISFYKTIIVL